ncbi:MAG: zf-HC2 domain-containing protein [Minwuia sp.]|nr:zf-HC2 domain-containing protein [Minwuia sp.]
MSRDPILLVLMRIMRGHMADRDGWRHHFAGWVYRTYPGLIDCGTFESFLMDYHEGNLPEANRRRFERHLSMCGLCRGSYRSYERSIQLGKRLFETDDAPLPQDVPPELISAVMSAMRAPPDDKPE